LFGHLSFCFPGLTSWDVFVRHHFLCSSTPSTYWLVNLCKATHSLIFLSLFLQTTDKLCLFWQFHLCLVNQAKTHLFEEFWYFCFWAHLLCAFQETLNTDTIFSLHFFIHIHFGLTYFSRIFNSKRFLIHSDWYFTSILLSKVCISRALFNIT